MMLGVRLNEKCSKMNKKKIIKSKIIINILFFFFLKRQEKKFPVEETSGRVAGGGCVKDGRFEDWSGLNRARFYKGLFTDAGKLTVV